MLHVLVLCISHVNSEANRIRALEVGADEYMESGDSYQFMSKVRSLFRVKHLSGQVLKQYEELQERNQILESHMRMGRKVQRALIPDIDMDYQNCKIMSLYQPAMGVSGDFYNVLKLGDRFLGIVMGDVSGHGVAASFLTVTLNVMIKNLESFHFEPGKLLNRLNNQMCALFGGGSDDPALYACVFYAIVDTEKRRICFANAGLVQPLLYQNTTGETSELDIVGSPIGMIEHAAYDQNEISYENGDALLLYTDGLQDCFYKNQPDEFLRHMKDLLAELTPREDMKEILDVICHNFYKTDASENERMELDDVSMLLCKL